MRHVTSHSLQLPAQPERPQYLPVRRVNDTDLSKMDEQPTKKRKTSVSDVLQNGSSTLSDSEALVLSSNPLHPANHICELCRKFYAHGWVTGTGGGVSIRKGDRVFIAPSGVQKELMQPTDIFVMDYASQAYLRRPPVG